MLTKRRSHIRTWQTFGKQVRSKGCQLLARLDDFPNSILVTGCQRSGTTALARIITTSNGMVNYWFGKDDELDAALILSGEVPHEPRGRYCFQTTYLNECYEEYFHYSSGHRIIWVIRNPYSVVYSMLHNWGRFALNELFNACGLPYLSGRQKRAYELWGIMAISRLDRACWCYVGKLTQLFALRDRIPERRLLVVDYDDLVNSGGRCLREIYEFINLMYIERYAEALHKSSVNKASMLRPNYAKYIEERCMPIYKKARLLSKMNST